MLPTDKEIKTADFITAVMQDDSDLLKIFRNPDLDPVVNEGEAYETADSLFVPCSSLDELFALRTKVRALRGKEGMLSKEERSDELLKLHQSNCPAFVAVFNKRTNRKVDLNDQVSSVSALRMLGNILDCEHAGE